MYTPLRAISWKQIRYLKTPWQATDEEAKWEYSLQLPEPLASWDTFSYWERARTLSMRDNLSTGDVLFDIGAEHGWLSCVYAQMVGPESMVLIEPTKEFWPNIKATWARNCNAEPCGFYAGLMGNKTTDLAFTDIDPWQWPPESDGYLIDKNKYQYIHQNEDNVPEITLDDYVSTTSIIPTAITIDVEGAEKLVLEGAMDTLKAKHPKVWVSVHPDLALRDYKTEDGDVTRLMELLGYKGILLSTDHEQHWYFY